MDLFLSRYRNLTVLLLLLLGQLILLAYQVKSNQDVRLIRLWAVTAVTPVARGLEAGRSGASGFFSDYLLIHDYRKENQNLKDLVTKLKLENQFLTSELGTADRAKALELFMARIPSKTIGSRIIGTGTGANSRAVYVDRGTVGGIAKGMAVITPDGIVGKVIAAYPTASLVMLVTESGFACGVISQKNRVRGTLRGQGSSLCIIDYVRNDEKVEPGEQFFTSGDDRIFPKGLPVGSVRAVRQGKLLKEILLAPAALDRGLEEVLIVTEGVHGEIPPPDVLPPPTPAVALLPPPPDSQPVPAPAPAASTVAGGPANPPSVTPAPTSGPALTEADRLKDRYRKIGEVQNHKYGDTVGRAPDFNKDPNAPLPTPRPSLTPTPAPAAAPSVEVKQP
jgi:rod shape-determining protein MreC